MLMEEKVRSEFLRIRYQLGLGESAGIWGNMVGTRRLELLTSTVSKARQRATPVFLSTYSPARALSGMLGNVYCSLAVSTQST